jgi:hypothetical protein
MNQEVKQKWLDALRSGQYLQGNGALLCRSIDNSPKYCCLGVLCDIHSKATGCAWDVNDHYEGCSSFVPDVVVEWAGLQDYEIDQSDEGFDIGTGEYELSSYNDNGHSFEEIAQLIENSL